LDEKAIESYRDLRVWQEAMALAESCYALSQSFPKEELFGLTSQIRRSAVSVPSNIAEGHGREHTGSFIQFLRVAQGSLKELETELLLAERIGVAGAASTGPALDRCASSLIRSLQQRKPMP